MSPIRRISCLAALFVGAVFASAAGSAPATHGGGPENFEFSGVSTVGKKTMVNLYDKTEKRSFWVEAGTTSGGVTVVSYDMQKDQITLRSEGREKLLPLRPPSAVVNGTAPVAAAPVAAAPAPTPALAAAPAAPLSQARQEEEARMLVSDLLEIGMAQRKAYEEAQKRQAAGQNGAAGNATTATAAGIGQAGIAAAQAGTPTQNAPAGPVAAPAQTTTPTGR